MPNDSELVRAALAGDRDAAGAIYDHYSPLVRAIARDGARGVHDANELVQEIFLTVLSRLAQLRQPDHLAGWIVQIARRHVIDSQRQQARRGRRETVISNDPVDSRKPTTDNESERIQRALSQLEENERIAVHLFYLCEQPVEVARQALGLSPSGFYKTMERARARLRQLLSQEESPR